MSPSSRRAWIEIDSQPSPSLNQRVALLAEGVDRNNNSTVDVTEKAAVALLAEGVDRNHSCKKLQWYYSVALLAEGVDRNSRSIGIISNAQLSPSSRRAWIEIT